MKRPIVLLTCLALSSCVSTTPSPTPAPTSAVSSSATASGLPACGPLPDEAWDTVDLIEAGGPFPYPANDDKRFGNYERVLPQESRNYYREYTVDTPGLRHRGARRIVTGGAGGKGKTARDVEAWYYTDDHYESFCEMEVN
ncbi:ribonuclease domain-containing protein [Corynebacterium coyleae]|uniref:ribonuclease domain-containing protein n=1 Tax=Corynebacterium coyleae TaxID=53374 RepID=UPI00254BC5DD|nr:ribonuclease domain-containing protein [Corynebacterium coyleae]MDK8241414.1 ribonuclease domain-containing protein [Corynebacterium coyleae]